MSSWSFSRQSASGPSESRALSRSRCTAPVSTSVGYHCSNSRRGVRPRTARRGSRCGRAAAPAATAPRPARSPARRPGGTPAAASQALLRPRMADCLQRLAQQVERRRRSRPGEGPDAVAGQSFSGRRTSPRAAPACLLVACDLAQAPVEALSVGGSSRPRPPGRRRAGSSWPRRRSCEGV